MEKKFEIVGKDNGPCPLCRGEKERRLFLVVGPYSGLICGDHLHTLTPEEKKEQPRPLFDKTA